MRRILALDISKTCTGFAVGEVGQKPLVGIVKFGKHKADVPAPPEDDVWAEAFKWTADMMRVHSPDVVYVEAPMERMRTDEEGNSFSSAHTLIVLAQLQAAMRTCTRLMLGSPAVVVRPQTARKSFTGRGNYAKGQAKPAVIQHCIRIGWLTPEEATGDKADALCLFGHGALLADKSMIEILRPTGSMPTREPEVLF